MPEQQPTLDTWAIVEVMGHKKYAGHLTEQVFGAASMFRVDVPETEQNSGKTPAYSKLIGVGSIYCITPCTEQVARAAAQVIERYNEPIPVDLPRHLLPASATATVDADLDDDDDDDDDDEYDEYDEYDNAFPELIRQ